MQEPCAAGFRMWMSAMTSGLGILAGPMLALATPQQSTGGRTADELLAVQAEIFAIIGVYDGRLVDLQLPGDYFSGWEADLPFGDVHATIDIEPHSLRSAHFRLLVQTEGGALVDAIPEPPRTYRGFVHGDPQSVVAVSAVGGTLTGTIYAPSLGGDFAIQPVAPHFAGAAASVHIVYAVEDAVVGDEQCGVADNAPSGADAGEGGADPPEGSGVLDMCQVAFDADFEFYQQNGSSVPNTVADIENIMNAVDAQYDRDVDIRYEITTIIVRSSPDDPYVSLDPNDLLDEFEAEWNANQDDVIRDTAHLMTGHNLSGSIIGIAHGFGFICDLDDSYSLAQSRFTTTYNRRVDLTAHELGHIWDAQHCNVINGTNFCSNCCTTPSFTMCSGLGFNLRNEFCPATKAIIIAHRDTRACLSLPAPELTLPLVDGFNSTSLNNIAIEDPQWLPFSGATVDGSGLLEPSGGLSLRLNSTGAITGSDQLRSRLIDASGVSSLTLNYWYERRGNGDSPEPGDDLFFEYLDNTLNWQIASQQLGDGPDMTQYEFVTVELPAAAMHERFRLRIRNIAGVSGEDDWFVDDVSVGIPAPLVTIVAANPPAAADNPYQPGQPFRDVLDTGLDGTLSAGIGADATPGQGDIAYSPISVTFSDTPLPAPSVSSITITCTGGVCPVVQIVTGSGAGPYSIFLDRAIPPGECTTISFAGTEAGQQLQYQSQPGNTNLDGITNTQDVLTLVQALNNGAAAMTSNLARYNVNRSSGVTPVNTQDLLRVIQLLNGVNTTQAFNAASVAACP